MVEDTQVRVGYIRREGFRDATTSHTLPIFHPKTQFRPQAALGPRSMQPSCCQVALIATKTTENAQCQLCSPPVSFLMC